MTSRPRSRESAALFLVGFMGCGKSSVGRIVAERAGRPFADTDALVEENEGRTIESIFRRVGEGHFREAEWRALQEIGAQERVIVATGGGLFLGLVQRRFMRAHGVVVWLDAPLSIVRERLRASAGRPLWLDADPIAQRAFFEKRRAVYALADARVEAGTGPPEAIASRVLARVDTIFH